MPDRVLRVAMVGRGFMGAAHSQGWRTAPRFFDLPAQVEMAVVVGRDADGTAAAAQKYGWQQSSTSWQETIARDDIDIVDVCVPGDLHSEVAVAALRAGKHVLCEKPLANTVAEAEAMVAAAEAAAAQGVKAMVGFTYRRVPAVQLARQLVAAGELGEIREARAVYLQDWLSDPEAPMTWRLDKAAAGSGALGDLGAHIVDMVQYLTGETVARVAGTVRTFTTERPLLASNVGLSGTASVTERGQVTVDDAALFLAELSGGAVATFEATRVAPGRKNGLKVEVNGTKGSLVFDLEDLNVLNVYSAADGSNAGFRRILVTEPSHPYVGAWWPPGHMLGYEHGFSHQVVDLVTAICHDEQPTPTFAEGLSVQRVLDAVERSSADDARWTVVGKDSA
jgi:predicted dehydrogenase